MTLELAVAAKAVAVNYVVAYTAAAVVVAEPVLAAVATLELAAMAAEQDMLMAVATAMDQTTDTDQATLVVVTLERVAAVAKAVAVNYFVPCTVAVVAEPVLAAVATLELTAVAMDRTSDTDQATLVVMTLERVAAVAKAVAVNYFVAYTVAAAMDLAVADAS